MNKRIFKQSLLALMLPLLVASCSDRYGDDLRSLGNRVEALEGTVLEAGKEIEAMWTLVKTLQSNGYISNIVENSDGTVTIEMTYFTDPDDPTSKSTKTYTLHPGTDGKEANMVISVKQDPYDGVWYWTLNGDWLRDNNNNRVRAGGRDGKDGKDGKDGSDGKDGVMPNLRVSPDGYWQISTDGGYTWTYITVGGQQVAANGKDGKEGRPDIFKSIELSPDGKSVIITLSTGQVYTVPLK